VSINEDEEAERIRTEGFCILRDHFPGDKIATLHKGFGPRLEAYERANRDKPNRGPNRHYIPLPFEPPFFDTRYFFDETALRIIRQILGDEVQIDQYASDTPFRGSVHQDIHSDVQSLFPECAYYIHPPQILALNFSLVDVTLENGAFEVARRSHRVPKVEGLGMIESGEFQLEPLLLKVGDVLIRDPRCLHRGSPNMTNTPRPVAVIAYSRHWFIRGHRERNRIPSEIFDTLSEEQQTMVERLRPGAGSA
jgi:hypothetical protein